MVSYSANESKKSNGNPHYMHGVWSVEKDANGAVFYEGRFYPSNLEYTTDNDVQRRAKAHAAGTAEWLYKRRVTLDRNKNPVKREPKLEEGAWTIRIVRERDNIRLFERQSGFKKMFPHTAAELERHRRDADDLHALREAVTQQRVKELPYEPKEESAAEEYIWRNPNLQWDFLRSPENPDHRYVLAKTHDPELVFQAAHYLHVKGMVTDQEYQKLNRWIAENRERENPLENVIYSFTIAVHRIDDFCKLYTASAIGDSTGPGHANQINRHSERNMGGRFAKKITGQSRLWADDKQTREDDSRKR